MSTILFLTILLVVAIAVVVRRNQAAEAADTQTDPFAGVDLGAAQLGIDRLTPGSVISHDDRDWIVRGSMQMEEDGYRWSEHLLDDGTCTRWLSVETDGGVKTALWEKLPVGQVDGEPGAKTVIVRGTTYLRDEQGTAAFTATGATGTAPADTVDYVDYVAGDRKLSFERIGASWEASAGRSHPVTEFYVFAAAP